MKCPVCASPVVVMRVSRVTEKISGPLTTLRTHDGHRILTLAMEEKTSVTDQETERFDIVCSNSGCSWFAPDAHIRIR